MSHRGRDRDRSDLEGGFGSSGDNGRVSRASRAPSHVSRTSRKSHHQSSSALRQSSRSRSRDHLHHVVPAHPQHYARGIHGVNPAHAHDNDSLNDESEDNWATSTDNNWTDYDQDIYMHRNKTKFGNRPFGSRDDVNL